MKNTNRKTVTESMRYLVILSMIGWATGSVIAQDAEPEDTTPPASTDTPVVTDTDTDTPDSKPAVDSKQVKQLVERFNVTEQQVLTMGETDRMGWGEIKNLLLIAQRMVKDSANTENPMTQEQALAEIQAQRQSGMGIGQIANSHKVPYTDLEGIDKNGKPIKVVRADKPEKPVKPEKPEKPAKPERPAKPEKPTKPDRPEKPAKPEKPSKVK